MRNVDRLFILPLLAVLAIGCSSPTAFQTSEYDDVYYSSKDKTIYKTNEAPVATTQTGGGKNSTQPSTEDVSLGRENSIPNPEYSGNSSNTTSRRTTAAAGNSEDYYSDDYYDDDTYYYSSRIKRFHTPYSGFDYYDFAYTDYYWYNRSPRFYGRIYNDPFYAYNDFLCYPPYGWGYPRYGNNLTVIIGGPVYGGYRRGLYSDPFYGGFGGGWYGNPYANGYRNGFNNGYYSGAYANSGLYRTDNTASRQVQYGPRTDRSSVSSGGGVSGGSIPSRPRRDSGSGVPGTGGVASPSENRGARTMQTDDTNRNTGTVSAPDGSVEQRRPMRRGGDATVNTTDNPGAVTSPALRETERPTRGNRVDTRSYEFPNAPTQVEEVQTSPRLRRSDRRNQDVSAPTTQPERRIETPTSQPEYRPRREQRPTYEAPRQQERPSYEAPRPVSRPEPSYQPSARPEQRTYEPQSRPAPSSSPAPSSGSDGGGRGGRPRD